MPTITIPEELAARVAVEAQARGLNLNDYAVALLVKSLPPTDKPNAADGLKEFLHATAALAETLPEAGRNETVPENGFEAAMPEKFRRQGFRL